MSTLCSVCGEKAGLLSRIKIKDGIACGDCIKKSLSMSDYNCRSVDEFKERFAYLEKNDALFNSFEPSIKIGDYLAVDEEKELFTIGKSKECFPFSVLVNFELNEDGETITKGGLGSAVVGGVLFGGAGAIVGSVVGGKKSKAVVSNMYIRISLNDKWVKNAKLNLITTQTKKDSLVYKMVKDVADRIISTLESIVDKQDKKSNSITGVADELLKLKQLLDMGVLTLDEFEAKKKQLLDL